MQRFLRRAIVPALIVLFAALCLSTRVSAQLISINFVGGGASAITPMAPSEVAGVNPTVNWNNAGGASGSLSNLVDITGAITAVSAVWSAPGTWSNGGADNPGDARMMKGYLNSNGNNGTPTTVTVSGLNAAVIYSVYVYIAPDSAGYSGKYTIGTQTFYIAEQSGFNGTYTLSASTNASVPAAGNYLIFTVSAKTSFTLSATPDVTAGGGTRAPINGIQVTALTAPAAPTNLTAMGGNNAVMTTWTASPGALSYTIKRSTTAGGPYTVLASGLTTTTYTDTTAVNGTTYYYVVMAVNGFGMSANSNQAAATPAAPVFGNGNGLYGLYFAGDDVNFTPLSTFPYFAEVDTTVNFNGGGNVVSYSPHPWPAAVTGAPINGLNFTAEWTGQFQSPVTGPVTFSVQSDDGQRLYVNGTLIIDNPNVQGPTLKTAVPIKMIAGQKYDIKYDYFQGNGGYTAQLLYSFIGQTTTVIPQSQLYSVLQPATLKGRIALEGVNDLMAIDPHAPLGTFRVSLRQPGFTAEVVGANVTLTPVGAGSPFGTYTVTGVPVNSYNVAIKGSKNLRVGGSDGDFPVAGLNGVLASGIVTLPDVLLPAGDADNDNRVFPSDFLLLSAHFGVPYSDPLYLPAVDFDFNGAIDMNDLMLLVGHYSDYGAAP